MIAGASSRMPGYRLLFTMLALISLPLAFATSISSLSLLMAEFFLAMFATAGFVIVGVSYATTIYTPQHAGLIAGLGAGSWSGVVGLLMPYIGRLFDQHNYTFAFQIAGAFPFVGYLAWLFLTRPGHEPATQ